MVLPTGIDILYYGIILLFLIIAIMLILRMAFKSNKNISIGAVKINGEPLSTVLHKEALLQKDIRHLERLIPGFYKDAKEEQRSYVREGVVFALDKMRANARELFCNIVQGCTDEEPEELRDYRLIAESARYYAIEIIMESVDRNHYNERTDGEWSMTKADLFAKVFAGLQKYFSDRYHSQRLTIDQLTKHTTQRMHEYKQVFDHTMDRCRAVSVVLAEKVTDISGKIEDLEAKIEKLFVEAN